MIILNNRIQKIALSTIFAFICFLTFVSLNTSTKAQSQEIIFPLASIVDGDLIKTSDNPDVYIVKIVSGNSYRRLIINPAVFESYDNLDWDDVKTVQSSTMNSFTVSSLVKEVNSSGEAVDGKVYMLFPVGDNGTKRHIKLTHAQFLEGGGSDNAVYNINSTEASDSFYATGTPITTVQDLRTLLGTSATTPQSSSSSNLGLTAPNKNPPTAINTRSTRSNLNENNQQSSLDTSNNNDNNNNNNNNNDNNDNNDNQDPPTQSITGQNDQRQGTPSRNAPRSTTPLTKPAFTVGAKTIYTVALSWDEVTDASGYVIETCKVIDGHKCIGVGEETRDTNGNIIYDTIGSIDTIAGEEVDNRSIIEHSYFRVAKTITSGSTTTATLTGLTRNATYAIRMKATHTNSARNSDYTATQNATTGNSEVSDHALNFRSIGRSTFGVFFRWNVVAGAEGYVLRYCKGATCDPSTGASKSGISPNPDDEQGLFYNLQGLSQDSEYRFTIAATLSGTTSAASSPIKVRTLMRAPHLTFGTPTENSIVVNWGSVPGAGFYEISICKKPTKRSNCSSYPKSDRKNVSANTVTFTGLDPNSVYQFKARSQALDTNFDGDRISGFSYHVYAATKFLPPTNIRSGSTKDTSMKLQWDSIHMSDGYDIQWCEGASCTPGTGTGAKTKINVVNSNANKSSPSSFFPTVTHEIIDLDPSTTYRFTVTTLRGAYDTLSNGSASISGTADSAESGVVEVTTRAS